jgi:hypothetical protein
MAKGKFMKLQFQPVKEHRLPQQEGSLVRGAADIGSPDQQCQRVLRCTARFMAATPGGLRFEPGTRPWLEGLDPASLAVLA